MITGISGIMRVNKTIASAVLDIPRGVTQEVSAPMCSHSIPPTTEETTDIPYGLCHCGCGQETNRYKSNDSVRGHVKGAHRKYVKGHNTQSASFLNAARARKRKPIPEPIIDDSGDYALIPLSSRKHPGLYAKVDIEDVDLVRGRRWYPAGRTGNLYATSASKDLIKMHRLILDFPEQSVDHINGDRLDNRRGNLRLCDDQGNQANRRVMAGSKTSRFRGVYREQASNRWCAGITVDGKRINLGRFDTEVEAAEAYDAAARESFGEFAVLNFDAAFGGGGER